MRPDCLREMSFDGLIQGIRVLDVGCGDGKQLRQLRDLGIEAVGIDSYPDCVARCQADGLNVIAASAEQIPFADATFDLVVSQVVLPYTEEAAAIQEMSRVLKPGGGLWLSTHGAGYYLACLLNARDWRRRAYCIRSLVNTLFYRASGRRLGGFWGDTMYQSVRRLKSVYAATGLELLGDTTSRYLGQANYIYHVLAKPVTTEQAANRIGRAFPESINVESDLQHQAEELAADVRITNGRAVPLESDRGNSGVSREISRRRHEFQTPARFGNRSNSK